MPDSRCRQTPVRFVNLWGHQGHFTFLPMWIEDLRCWLHCVVSVEALRWGGGGDASIT